MKHKILLTGSNRTTIDDFFQAMASSFDCVSSSLRFEDLSNHIKFFNPEILVYCLSNEARENISQVSALRHRFKDQLYIIIIGDPDECEEFTKIAVNSVDLVLTKPLTANSIEVAILKFSEDKQREKEEIALRMKQLEEEQRAKEEAMRKKHVLVIDDDILMLKSLKEQLHEKYDVATALTGKLGLKFLESKKVDLILLDYEMPNESGPEVLSKIRENSSLVDIPVLFLTGVTDREKIQNALSMKPQGYMLKPINHEKLMETIASFIG